MKTTFLLSIVCALITSAVLNNATAQERAAKPGDPYAFSTRAYRFPSEELTTGFVSKERGKLRAPALPPASASKGEMEVFLKRSHSVVKEYLKLQGIDLPPGSLVCFNPATSTLVLRTMAAAHDVFKPFADSMYNQSPKLVGWQIEIVEAPAAAVRAAIRDGVTGKSDHAAALEQLVAAQARIVTTMRGETKSGQKMSSAQSANIHVPVELSGDEKHGAQATFVEEHPFGTQVEMEPTIGNDGEIIDLNIALTHQHSGPIPRWDRLTSATAAKIEAEWLDLPKGQIQTSLTFRDGATRMLGVFALDGAIDPASADKMRAAFIRLGLVRVLPLDDGRVEQLVKAHGEAVEPTPKAVRPVADPNLPPGMIVRRFRVPPDFESVGSAEPQGGAAAAPPADPFASGPAANEPRFMRRVTAEDILRAAGIPFPKGASANYLRETSELVARNTPSNIELIEAFLLPLDYGFKPRQVSFSAHIIQADAALIRKLSRETMSLSDHTAAWKAVEDAEAQGKAKVLRSVWLETKSGQRATSESVIEYSLTTETGIGGASRTESSSAPKSDDAKSGAVAKATVINGDGSTTISATSEVSPVGLRLEIEPTVGNDNTTLDLNLSFEYDYSPPVQRVITEPPPPQTLRLAAPRTEFREAKVSTSITMLSGSTRLLGVWKPEGNAELDGDVLQAAFLRADIVPVEAADK